MYVLYLWFLGVRENRIGGPWWNYSLPHWVAVELFLADCSPFLYAYASVQEQDLDKNEYFIVPPKGAKIIYPNGKEDVWEKV